jgi:hypothetical protein
VCFLAIILKGFAGFRTRNYELQPSMNKSCKSAISHDNSLQLSLVKRSIYGMISGNEFATYLENGYTGQRANGLTGSRASGQTA